jgi:hypothetical protein
MPRADHLTSLTTELADAGRRASDVPSDGSVSSDVERETHRHPAEDPERSPSVADRIRRLSTRERAVLALMTGALALGPVLVSLQRDATYRSRVEFGVASTDRAAPERSTAYVAKWAREPQLRSRLTRVDGLDRPTADSLVDGIEVTSGAPRGGKPTVVVSVPAATPGRAHELASLVAAAVSGESARVQRVVTRARAYLARARKALRDAELSPERRAALLERARFTRVAAEDYRGVGALEVAAPPTQPLASGLDRVIDDLVPGDAPRPSPVFAGATGLILGLTLGLLWTLLGPPRGSRRVARSTARHPPGRS